MPIHLDKMKGASGSVIGGSVKYGASTFSMSDTVWISNRWCPWLATLFFSEMLWRVFSYFYIFVFSTFRSAKPSYSIFMLNYSKIFLFSLSLFSLTTSYMTYFLVFYFMISWFSQFSAWQQLLYSLKNFLFSAFLWLK